MDCEVCGKALGDGWCSACSEEASARSEDLKEASVTNLQEYKNSKVEPEPHLVAQDEDGRKLYTFGYEFDHSDGSKYSFHFLAYDFEDAEKKMESIRKNGRIYGKVYGEIPA